MKTAHLLIGLFVSCSLVLNGCSSFSSQPERTVEEDNPQKNLVNQIMKSSPCYVNNDVQDCLDNAKQYRKMAAKYLFDKDNRLPFIYNRIYSFVYSAHGCQLNDRESCFITANNLHWLETEDTPVHQNIIANLTGGKREDRNLLEFTVLRKACHLDYIEACMDLASFKESQLSEKQDGFMNRYYKGIVDRISNYDMETLYIKSCKANKLMCAHLVRLYSDGWYVKKDLEKAKYYKNEVCSFEPDGFMCESATKHLSGEKAFRPYN